MRTAAADGGEGGAVVGRKAGQVEATKPQFQRASSRSIRSRRARPHAYRAVRMLRAGDNTTAPGAGCGVAGPREGCKHTIFVRCAVDASPRVHVGDRAPPTGSQRNSYRRGSTGLLSLGQATGQGAKADPRIGVRGWRLRWAVCRSSVDGCPFAGEAERRRGAPRCAAWSRVPSSARPPSAST